jgi:hypothetical protein
MTRRILLSVVCLACLQLSCLAQDIQARAEELLQHARQLSDIRSPNSRPFRLKALFSFIGDDLETVQGTYDEIWISNSRWRRDTTIGNLHKIEIGGPDKVWVHYPDGYPVKADKLPALMAILPPASSQFEFTNLDERAFGYFVAQCAYSRPYTEETQFVFCFDRKTGLPVEKVTPDRRPRNVMNLSCEYGRFQKFGDRWFPRQIVCFEDKHASVNATVVELLDESTPDSSLFIPSEGAIEVNECSGKIRSPVAHEYLVSSPFVDLDLTSWVKIWFMVDAKGIAQNPTVLRAPDKKSADGALWMLHVRRFTPGTCDGQPFPMPVIMLIPSQLR